MTRHLTNIIGITVFVGILTLPLLLSANLLSFEKQSQSQVLGVAVRKINPNIQIESKGGDFELNQDITLTYQVFEDNIFIYDQILAISNNTNTQRQIAIVTMYPNNRLFFGEKNQISGPILTWIEPGRTKTINLISYPSKNNQTEVAKLQFRLISL